MGVIENRIDILELERSGGGGGGTAASVSYDNTTSHMTATDVQAALDELNLDIAEGLALVNTSVAANREAIIATQETIAPVEDEATSSAAYEVGDYLMHNNVLMRVTAAIAIGDTLTVGTNIAAAEPITDNLTQAAYTDIDISNVDTTAITISSAKYMIKNGICFVMYRFETLVTATTGTLKSLGKLPIPQDFQFVFMPCLSLNDTAAPGYGFISYQGDVNIDIKNLPIGGYRAFVSYPV